jgi:hypothetical protein
MKILHCCLASFYIDDYGYQENKLPKMHKLQGHEVSILASTETFLKNSVIGYINSGSYRTKDGIPVTRINYISWLPHFFVKKLRIYSGVGNVIEKFKPDIIFIHGSQFISIKTIASYAKKHPTIKIYVDGHTDFINSATNWFSKNILHKVIYKWCTKKINPFTRKFYGVLPLRVKFISKVYGISPSKVELLELGVDPYEVHFENRFEIREKIRKELNIGKNHLVLITGGKINEKKQIASLMEKVKQFDFVDLVLIVFGSCDKEMESKIKDLSLSNSIRYIGWIAAEKINDYFLASDLAIFPGTHSILWEQAVGLGLPCIFKRWEGMQHVDLKGNCLFFETGEELNKLILSIYNNRNKLEGMKRIAENKGMKKFSYYEIAKRAIEQN